jgi:hypothetical protein
MTSEERLFITLDEIIGVQYKCNKCGTTIIMPRDKWDFPQQRCPNSNCSPDVADAARWIGIESSDGRELQNLQKAIRALSALRGVGCTLSLEIRKEREK